MDSSKDSGSRRKSSMKNTAQQSPNTEGINTPKSPTQVPWPGIFNSHISCIKGHLKMLKLIRMHTATDSVYWAHINAMIDRTGEMLIMSDSVIRDFIPSGGEAQDKSQSSSSSPKHKLEDTEPTVPTKSEKKVKVASPPTSPKRKLSDTEPTSHESSKKAAKAARKRSSASNIDPATTPTASGTTKAEVSTNGGNAKGKSNSEHFFVDTNPTPFNTPAVPSNKSSKRREPPSTDETTTVKKSKKAKVEHYSTIPITPIGAKQVEFEDITAEVDARLQAKEEKRRKAAEEEEKKRAKEAENLKEFITAKARETPSPTQPTSPAEKLADLSIRKRKRKQSIGGASGESHTENSFIVPKKPKNKGNLGAPVKKRTSSSAYEAGDEGDGGKISTVLGGGSAGTAARPKKKAKTKKGKEKEDENEAPGGGE